MPSDQSVHEMFQLVFDLLIYGIKHCNYTYFWSPNGQRIPLQTVIGFKNFQAVPFVEVEDVFVSKAVRSMQLKLRECIVYPPSEQPQMRFSVCFPDQVCSRAPDQNSKDAALDATAEDDEAHPAKKLRISDQVVLIQNEKDKEEIESDQNQLFAFFRQTFVLDTEPIVE